MRAGFHQQTFESLEPGCASRNHESLVAPDVGSEFVAAVAEHDKVRARKRPLETIPILFVAQGGWDESVGASDPVVVRDDGVAFDLDRAALRFLWGERAHDQTLYSLKCPSGLATTASNYRSRALL
jgi:hypothetical protein